MSGLPTLNGLAPEHQGDDWVIYRADALAALRAMPPSSIDLVLTDPPYFRVKSEPWDRAWDSSSAFLAWIGELSLEWRRVLRANGSLYVFASPAMASRVEVEIGQHFRVLNHVVWVKHDGGGNGQHSKHDRDKLRAWAPQTERLIFAEQVGADAAARGESTYHAKCAELRGFVFEPIRAYLDGERLAAGVSLAEVNAHTRTQMASHWFSTVQWTLPTARHFRALRELFQRSGAQYLRREYEQLRREYEQLRREYEQLRREYEQLRRPFLAPAKPQPFTDVWSFETVPGRAGKHPCEKPAALLEHVIAASSRPGATVLDCFAGSGSAGASARKLGRRFLGVELSDRWCLAAAARVAAAAIEPTRVQPRAVRRFPVQAALPLEAAAHTAEVAA